MKSHLALGAALILAGLARQPAFAGAGDVARGKDLADGRVAGVPACGGCHGGSGEGQADIGAPRLAGLAGGYLQHQLAGFAAGTRENAVMGPIARALKNGTVADVAAYYASLPVPAGTSPPTGETGDVMRGRALALHGDWSANLPACAACHGLRGLGVGAAFPALAGQGASYLAAQLRAWKARTRRNDPSGLMSTVAGRLDDGQVAAVSAYYASLSAGKGSTP